MKTTALVLVLVMVVASMAYGAMEPVNRPMPKKMGGVTGTPTYEGRDGGEDIATAVVIPSLPFTDTGNTCPYLDDYYEFCPYEGEGAPDVVYAYTPAADIQINIDMCNSLYDTKVFVYEDMETPGSPYACNDDFCGLQSGIEMLQLYGGHTYYIVVDGYSTACGDYELVVEEYVPPQPCVVTCPDGAMIEGEETCYDQYVDTYNGGCNSVPEVFQPITLNTTICGESGNYMFDDGTGPVEYRDMDWYELVLTEEEHVEFCVCADFPVRLWIVDGNLGCASATTVAWETSDANYELCIDAVLQPGTYWLLVSVSDWLSIPCGVEYTARVYEFGYTPVEGTSWGTIKSIYR